MRIRSIKPEFWTSEDIARLDWPTRLLFIGLWSYVDDNGVGRDNDKLIKADLFPLEAWRTSRTPAGTCSTRSRCAAACSTCPPVDTDGVTIHLQRPRLFESNWGLRAPKDCDHSAHEWVAGAYGGARRDKYEAKYVRKGGYVPPDKAVVKRLLGVEHDMTWNGLYESVPPAYTEYIGRQLAETLTLGTTEGEKQ